MPEEMAEAFLSAIPAEEFPHLVEVTEHTLRTACDAGADFEFGPGLMLPAFIPSRSSDVPATSCVVPPTVSQGCSGPRAGVRTDMAPSDEREAVLEVRQTAPEDRGRSARERPATFPV